MSKFSGLLQAKQAQSLSPEVIAEQHAPAESISSAAAITKIEAPATKEVAAASAVNIINVEPGRGKKGHHDYNQVTIYLRKETHKKAKIALLQSGDERDFSEFVEDLLIRHLESKHQK